jgi:hypothetical protein
MLYDPRQPLGSSHCQGQAYKVRSYRGPQYPQGPGLSRALWAEPVAELREVYCHFNR